MTMLSAQPITLTGEQHDRLWRQSAKVRGLIDALTVLREACDAIGLSKAGTTLELAELDLEQASNAIERILIDAQDAAPPATASSGEAA